MRTTFFDVDTQYDFMRSDGALYVPKAESIIPNLTLLTQYAINNKIQIMGSVDRHFDSDAELAKNGGPFPDHCMDGTIGQKKIFETGVKAEFLTNSFDYSLEFLRKLGISDQNIFFEKQGYDVFDNINSTEILLGSVPRQAVVYGVATDYCVKAAVIGMIHRNIETYVITDAIKGITPEGEKTALDEMVRQGAKLITTEEVLKKDWQ